MSLYDNVIPLAPRNLRRFGICPKCGKGEGPTFNHDGAWFLCEAHGVKWRSTARLAAGWQLMDPLEQLTESTRLLGMKEIEPYVPGRRGPDDEGAA